MDVTAIGEVLIDLTQTGVNEQNVPVFAANPGGAPANTVVAAARLGASAAFLGKVGEDGFGDYLTGVLWENGVDVSGMRKGKEPTTMAVVSVDPSGERNFRFIRGADAMLMADEVDTDLIQRSGILHFGSVSLTVSPAREATLYAVETARKLGKLVSYDPNYRAALWSSRKAAIRWMQEPLPLVDVLKVSEEELPMVAGTADYEEGTGRLHQLGIRLILVTLGERGVFYRLGEETGAIPGFRVSTVDTNGAGDTFFGAVLCELCQRKEMDLLKGLKKEELERILAFANRAAALTCSRSGAIPAMPNREELEE